MKSKYYIIGLFFGFGFWTANGIIQVANTFFRILITGQ